MKELSFTTSIQHLQVATQPSTVVAVPIQRDPTALLQQATGGAAAKFDKIKAVFQKVDEPQPRPQACGSQVCIDLPELGPEAKASQPIEAGNIRALQAMYLGEMVDEMRVPKVSDRLVELFQNGFLSIASQAAGAGAVPERDSFFSGRLLAANDLQAEQQSRRKESVLNFYDFKKLS